MKTALLALVLLLVAATPAEAAFTLANASSKPDDVSAGANSNVKIHVEPQGGQIRDLTLHLPAGLIGNPQATPKCPMASFDNGGACPDNTRVGTASNTARLGGLLPQTVTGPIFNLQVPQGDRSPAILGIRVDTPFGPILLKSPATTRPADQGLDSTLKNIPNTVGGVSIDITALDVELFGKVGTQSFMTNPTSCGVAETGFDAVSYNDEKATAKASFTPTKCDALPFEPKFSAVLGGTGTTAKGTHPELTTTITQVAGEANTKRVSVTLPKVLTVELSQFARACKNDAVAAGSCPQPAIIGQATAVTPLLTSPLLGPVILAEGATPLPDVVLDLKGQLNMQLRGVNTFTPQGQQTTFDGLPDVPLSRFELRFDGGSSGLLTTGLDLCDIAPPVLNGTFLSHSGKTTSVRLPATIQGCSGKSRGGTTTSTKAPTVKLRVVGRSVRLTVDGRGRRLKRVKLTLPKGVELVKNARGTTSGSGAKGSTLKLTAKTVTLTVPGNGAQRLGLALRSGSVKGVKLLRKRKASVSVLGTDGKIAKKLARATK